MKIFTAANSVDFLVFLVSVAILLGVIVALTPDGAK